MKELIFNIKDIFNNYNHNGCLSQYDSSFYHIPAYQRGYKWASNQNGAVTILLSDLWKAFDSFIKQEKSEYYLQYITVKKIELVKGNCLEVIDGQQRLTTLSILLSVLSLKLDQENLAGNKLDYAIRDNFFEKHIYPKEKLKAIIVSNWKDLQENKILENNQDVFYMANAAITMNAFFTNKNLHEFYDFVLNQVKIIVNSVEEHVSSETVFKNLNSNKVPLTEAELIKGLLITKVGRTKTNQQTKHFKEIMEIRMNIGRHWDEINHWANKPEIKSFYFNNKQDAIHELLALTAACQDDAIVIKNLNNHSKDFPLFNYYLEQTDCSVLYNKLLAVKNTLEDWYNTTEIYNLLGYCRFTKQSGKNNLNFLKECIKSKTKTDLIENKLNRIKIDLITNIDFNEISYEETPEKIHQILLHLSVFIKGQENTRFDFYQFEKEKWTLEHIFPQTPEGKNKILNNADKEAIKQILVNVSDEVNNVLQLEVRTEEEKNVYYKALKEHPALSSIANMCLLTGGDNSSNGNKFFNEKRLNILSLIQRGSFVPKHTFDVFSKMFSDSNTESMNNWTISDFNAHLEYIKSSIGCETIESTELVESLSN
jgi:hypothetical protein